MQTWLSVLTSPASLFLAFSAALGGFCHALQRYGCVWLSVAESRYGGRRLRRRASGARGAAFGAGETAIFCSTPGLLAGGLVNGLPSVFWRQHMQWTLYHTPDGSRVVPFG